MARQQRKGECPSCGKRGLGNIYIAAAKPGQPPRAYRQCQYCSEIHWLDQGKEPA